MTGSAASAVAQGNAPGFTARNLSCENS